MVAARLRPGGVYTMNVVDYGPRDFLRAEAATLSAGFDHVAVIGRAGSFGPARGDIGGNFVLVASDEPLPVDAIVRANERRARDDEVLVGSDLDAFVGDAQVLVDDFAPVDQLLTPLPRP